VAKRKKRKQRKIRNQRGTPQRGGATAASVAYQRALRLTEAGRYEAALAVLQELVAAEPEFALAFNLMGVCFVKQVDYAAAQKAYERALQLAPESPLAYYNLGALWTALGNYARAIENYERALALNPADEAAREKLALARRYQSWEQPLELAPQALRQDTVPTISLCLIAKNEAQNLPRLFASLGEAVDEIIVVDTGSTDETVEVARAWGAQVYHFEWVDDFSAAKNFALEQATCDWVLHLDADMQFPPGEAERIRPLVASGAGQAYWLLVRSDLGDGRQEIIAQPWLFKRMPGIRFRGAVHEQLYPQLEALGIEPVKTNLTVEHLGYQDNPEMRARFARDIDILQARLKAGEDDFTTHFYLGRAHLGLGQYPEAIRELRRALAEPRLHWRLRAEAFTSLARAHFLLKDFEAVRQTLCSACWVIISELLRCWRKRKQQKKFQGRKAR